MVIGLRPCWAWRGTPVPSWLPFSNLFPTFLLPSSPYINRFLQPDSIIPAPASPQSWNRYSYVINNPINASDPTGHECVGEPDECLNDKGKPINGAGGWRSNADSPINDPDWDNEDKHTRDERTKMVWEAICQSGGWWGSGCPSEQELVTWLLYEEGGPLLTSEYEKNMARGMRYRFAYFVNLGEFGNAEDASFILQLSAFTAFFNPDSDGDFDQVDWDTLTNPSYDLTLTASVVEEVYSTEIKASDGNYLYWWDATEVKTDRSQWPGTLGTNFFQTATVTGLPFYFTGIPNIRSCAMNNTNCK